MKKNIKIGILLIIVILTVYGIFTIAKNKYDTKIRIDMVTHIIENPTLYEEEFKEMGYDLAIFYTFEDNINWYFETGLLDEISLQQILDEFDEYIIDTSEKLGYMGRGEIQLTGKGIEYTFDVGLYYIVKDLENDAFVSIFNNRNNEIINLNARGYPLDVELSVPDASEDYSNMYNMDFTEYFTIFGRGKSDDDIIKEYVSKEELRKMLHEGLDLDTQMIKMYKNKRKIS